MTTDLNKFFVDGEIPESVNFSVDPVVDVLSFASNQVDIPESEHKIGETFSVCSGDGGSAYCWLKPASRRFAEIFITVTAAAKRTYQAARRFIRNTVCRMKMSLTVRRTVCLRL